MTELTYGEVTEAGLVDLLERVAACIGEPSVGSFTSGATFIDLGSGNGGAVLSVARCWPELHFASGVELVQERHQEAVRCFSAACTENDSLAGRVRFVCGDILTVPWDELAHPCPWTTGGAGCDAPAEPG